MRLTADNTGRFPQRPYYEEKELDCECERIITEFMVERYGKFYAPIPTDALMKLIERDANELDIFADLSKEGQGVQGVTDFFPKNKPNVRISVELSDGNSEHRFRTTLTHEYGHVCFHAPLYDNLHPTLDLFPVCCDSHKCHRDAILQTNQTDWMEWQAGYVCGALLMPSQHIKQMLATIAEKTGVYKPVVGTTSSSALINTVSDVYEVSKEAARIRLLRLGLIVPAFHENTTLSE